MPSREETGRIPQINGFGSCWERPPKPPSGPASQELRSLPASQGHHHGGSSIWYSRPQPDIARAQPHLGAKICSLKWAQELEAPKLTRQLVERRVRFTSKACNREGSFRPKADSTPTSQRAELLRMGGRGPSRNFSVSSDGHPEVGHQCSDQCHLDCFKCGLQFQGQFVPVSSEPVLRIVAACHGYWLPWRLRQSSACLQCRRPGFDPWVGKIPGEGNSSPLQYSCLENPMDRGAW